MAFGNLFENLFDTYIVGKASVNVYRCKSLNYFYKIYYFEIGIIHVTHCYLNK